tara:strand:+ start:231 stop:758 length:528 start_codon:yes stop_codon:yes gene_type:complete
MANISDFVSKLKGGGARANQFKVTMPFPGFAAVGGETESMAFLCSATTLPASTLTEITVPFRGRNIYMAGDREFEQWSTTIINDTDFLIRNAIERWSNGINNMSDNEGLVNPVDYQVDAFVDHLDRNGNTIKSYTFRGMFPVSLGTIDLNYDPATALETFECTWRYQYWESNTTT